MTEQPPIVIQILGLGHSGSTLLETLLWEAFGVLALGETSAVLRGKKGSAEGTDDMCSCGTSLGTCPFWAKLSARKKSLRPEDAYAFYKELLAQVKAHGASAITDSSPSQHVLPVLQQLEREGHCRLKVVYLTRSPQGWIVLFRRMLGHVYVKSGIKRAFYSFPPRVAHFWYKENRRCSALAKSLGAPCLTISYEQLALAPVSTLAAVRDFAGLTATDGPANPDMRHISYSHRTKFTTLSIKDIVYDTEWFSDWSAQFAVLSLPYVRRFARSHVPLPTFPKKQ